MKQLPTLPRIDDENGFRTEERTVLLKSRFRSALPVRKQLPVEPCENPFKEVGNGSGTPPALPLPSPAQ